MAQNISLLQAAYRFANKLFAEYSLDSNGNPVGFTGPNGNAGWIDAGFFGASPSASAATNVAAIQKALNYANSQGGGRVSITIPGIYQMPNAPAAATGTVTNYGSTAITDYADCYIYDNTEVYIAKGVALQGQGGGVPFPLFCNINANSNSISVSNNVTATGTYSANGTTVTVTMPNNFYPNTGVEGGVYASLTFTSGGFATAGSAGDGSMQVVATGNIAGTSFTFPSTLGATTGNVSLIAYTPQPINGQIINNQAYMNVTVNTATSHNMSAGSFVLFKGDTSSYGFNHTWKIIAVPTATSFIIQTNFDELVSKMSGTVIAYPANDNIKITVDGFLSSMNNQSAGWFNQLLSESSMYFNKVGNLEINGNFIDSTVPATVCNIDYFLSQYSNQRKGANHFQFQGPIRRVLLRNVVTEQNQEIAIFADDPSGVGATLSDANGTVNSGGNIGSILIDGGDFSYNSGRAVAISPGNYIIDEIVLSNIRMSNSVGSVVDFGQITGESGTVGRIVFDTVQLGAITQGQIGGNASLIQFHPATVTIDYLGINNLQFLQDTSSLAQLAVSQPGIVQLEAATAATINKVSITNSQIPLFAAASGNPYTPFNFSVNNWTVNSIYTNNIKYTEVGSGTVASTAVVSNAANNVHKNITLLAKNLTTTIASAYVNGNQSPRYLFDNIDAGSAASAQPAIMWINTASKTYNVTVINSTLANTGASNGGFVINMNSTSATVNLTLGNLNVAQGTGGSKTGQWFIYNPTSGDIFNIRSMGGNQNPLGAQWNITSGVTYNFYGNCSDLQIDITKAAKIDGANVYNTNASAGTLGHAGVVSCDYDSVTAGLLWKRITGITAGVAAIGTY